MKIVFSIGGSILFPEEGSRAEEYKEVIGKLNEEQEIKIVVGGGWKARKVVAEARKKGLNEGKCDELAIGVTRENAKKLIEVLGFGFKEVPLSIDEAAAIKGLTVMGGTHIGHTTDAVAAMLAEYWDADLLVIGTNVDAVYEEDPDTNPDAKKFEKLSAKELVEITMKNVMKATSAGVVDPHAAKIIERSGIKTRIVDGRVPENLEKVVSENVGTEIN